MTQRVLIDRLPVPFHERAHQKQQGRLRLMEIRYQLIYDSKRIPRLDHNLCLCVQCRLSRLVQIIQNRLQSIMNRQGIFFFVWLKLRYSRILRMTPNKIEALQRAHTRCSHRYDLTQLALDMRNRLARYSYNLRVHRMFVRVGCLNRQECTRTHMQRHLVRLNTASTHILQDLLRKMQTGRRRGYRSFDT